MNIQSTVKRAWGPVSAAVRWLGSTPSVILRGTRRLRGAGLSILGFGVNASWEPPPATEAARLGRVVTFLENRRVLYDPTEIELPDRCFMSVVEIREFLEAELIQEDRGSILASHLRGMSAECRTFLTRTQAYGIPGPTTSWSLGYAVFGMALGELRRGLGFHLAALVAPHELEVRGSLRDILPATDDLPPAVADGESPKSRA